MGRTRQHLLISGRVQGVCFRHHTRKTAIRLGVSGWVRNLPDGRVEAMLEGDETAVAAALAWCHQGPELARVDTIEAVALPAKDEFSDFTIR